MEKLPRKRKTDEEKKEKKKESRKKYEQSQHIVCINKDVFDCWQEVKSRENLKTNNEMANYLLDLWEASQTTTETAYATPIKNPAVQLLQSTPISGPSSLPELKISDISASEKSDSSGTETGGLVEKYEARVKVIKGSFVEISYSEETPKKKDISYYPTLSEDEEAYDEEYDYAAAMQLV